MFSQADPNRIRRIEISSRVVTTLAGSGSAGSTNGVGTAATFYAPNQIALDSSGVFALIVCTVTFY